MDAPTGAKVAGLCCWVNSVAGVWCWVGADGAVDAPTGAKVAVVCCWVGTDGAGSWGCGSLKNIVCGFGVKVCASAPGLCGAASIAAFGIATGG